ncbi:MAG: hypothetical protein K2M62_01105 [Muribaculaceae bacterium]|nr:hypothetical protein [Bacteroidales bacterium]MDE7508698.1 hypothetical protein [Muribaculaceae bacterium]
MKKVMTIALCMAAVGSLSAQKANVDAAKKLSGKFDKIEEARSLIQQAMQNPETANDANTYYVAGKIEFDAYDKGLQAGMIDPSAAAADPIAMGQELLNGYEYFMKAFPLDQIPDEKGKANKYGKDMVNKLVGHTNDYFSVAGAKMYEANKYYPEAYNAFMIYADMPELEVLGAKAPKIEDNNRAQAYFNAGLSAYVGKEVIKAADAFNKARNLGYTDPESNGANAYIYEIACWQSLLNDSTISDEAQKHIFEIAKAGNEKFGMANPVFLNNLVNGYVIGEQYDNALATVNDLLASNPDNSNLYGLLGFIYDRAGNDQASLDSYLKAVAIADCGYETLMNAAKKLYRVGSEKFNDVDASDAQAKNDIRNTYYDPALAIAKRAKAMNQEDGDADHVIEAIEYVITTNY